jgi:HlyD family secretion protein
VDPTRIFRKVSLDRLASPEQLDQTMQVTTPRGWIALATIVVLMSAAAIWAFEGSLLNKVSGRGILVRSGGVLEVVAPASGRISDVAVTVGDSVTQGQVVAWLAQPELNDQVQQARAKLHGLRIQQEQSVRFADQDAILQRRALAQERTNLEQSIAATEDALRWLTDRAAAQEQLVAQGLLTRSTLVGTRQQYEQTREKIRSMKHDLAQVAVRELDTDNHRHETIRNGEMQLEQAQADFERLDAQLKSYAQIVSPYTGRILEVMTEQGKIVARGEPVLSLDLTGHAVQDLVAIVYVPSLQGKLVRPGMQIQIAPSTVRREEFGMMLGKVTFVSDFPATPKGMERVLKNDQLVNTLSGGGAPYEVHAELVVDPETPSQYRWSSSKGPPTKIQSGTLALASITVESQRPIAKVIPLMRKWTGI